MKLDSTITQVYRLEEYWELFGSQYLRVILTRVKPGIPRTRYGYFEIDNLLDCEWILTEYGFAIDDEGTGNIEHFFYDNGGSSCSFTWNSIIFQIHLSPKPTDNWGNYLDREQKIVWNNSECREVLYSDAHCFEFDNEFAFSEYILDNDLVRTFAFWFLDTYSNYSFISCIRSHSVVNVPHPEGFSYYTTNEPFTSKQWQSVFNDFETHQAGHQGFI